MPFFQSTDDTERTPSASSRKRQGTERLRRRDVRELEKLLKARLVVE